MEKIDLPGMRVPNSITFDRLNIYVDGVAIALSIIPQMLYEMTHPSSRKWYCLERIENKIVVHVRVNDEPFEGMPIATIGE